MDTSLSSNTSVSPVTPTKTRKRIRQTQKWKINVAKQLKYSPKALPDFPSCGRNTSSLKCATLRMVDLMRVHKQFYSKKDKTEQDNIILRNMTVSPVNRRRPKIVNIIANSFKSGIVSKTLMEKTFRSKKGPKNVLVRGEVNYRSDSGLSKLITKSDIKASKISPDLVEKVNLDKVSLAKLKDVENLLNVHYGSDWQKNGALTFYKEVLSTAQGRLDVEEDGNEQPLCEPMEAEESVHNLSGLRSLELTYRQQQMSQEWYRTSPGGVKVGTDELTDEADGTTHLRDVWDLIVTMYGPLQFQSFEVVHDVPLSLTEIGARLCYLLTGVNVSPTYDRQDELIG
ncbi:hypothetical protein J6590_084489 [Homalodisca vitripennis]|nr:hypothetical protein J6590_084489 [Homalodisca vitripennis]